MLRILRFLFGIDAIESRWMAYLITASVAHACTIKGIGYVNQYPGWTGWFLFALSPLTAVVVGTNLLALVKRGRADAVQGGRNMGSDSAGRHPAE